MKKLWNHYEPLELDETTEPDQRVLQQQLAPIKSRTTWSRVKSWLFHMEPYVQQNGQSEIAQALMQWKNAKNYFENVSDPVLIDYAILDMEAAQKRYIYLLKQAK